MILCTGIAAKHELVSGLIPEKNQARQYDKKAEAVLQAASAGDCAKKWKMKRRGVGNAKIERRETPSDRDVEIA